MSTAHRLIDFVNDDELAMQNVKKLLAHCRYDRQACREIAAQCGVSDGLIRTMRANPERCTVRTYGLMCRAYGWSEYVPGRKLSPSQRQEVIPFEEASGQKIDMSRVDEEYADSLSLIAEFRKEPLEEVLGRAVKEYISANGDIVDFMRDRKAVKDALSSPKK